MGSRTIRLAVVGGDGIGPEVVAEALKVLRAAGVSIAETEYDLGARRWHRTGETLPDAVLEEIRGHDAILLGAVGDPSAAFCCGCGSSSITTSTFARYACIRASPSPSLTPGRSPWTWWWSARAP